MSAEQTKQVLNKALGSDIRMYGPVTIEKNAD